MMEIMSIGAYKGSLRKEPYTYRPADEGVVDNKKREGNGQRSELVRNTADGDMVALSFNRTVSFEERKAIVPVKSSLAKENSKSSFVSRGNSSKSISDIEKLIISPLNIDTQSVTDQNMISKVTTDLTGYAINKYREAWAYRRWAVTTLEVYA